MWIRLFSILLYFMITLWHIIKIMRTKATFKRFIKFEDIILDILKKQFISFSQHSEHPLFSSISPSSLSVFCNSD